MRVSSEKTGVSVNGRYIGAVWSCPRGWRWKLAKSLPRKNLTDGDYYPSGTQATKEEAACAMCSWAQKHEMLPKGEFEVELTKARKGNFSIKRS